MKTIIAIILHPIIGARLLAVRVKLQWLRFVLWKELRRNRRWRAENAALLEAIQNSKRS